MLDDIREKNIAIVIDSLTGGGAERVMLSLGEELINQGNKVTLLSLGNRCEYELPNGIDVDYLFPHKASKVDRFWQIKKSVIKLEAWFEQKQAENKPFNLVLSNLDRSNNLLAKSQVQSVYYVVHNSITEELNRQKKMGPLAYYYLLKSKKNLSGKKLITVSHGIEQEIAQSSLITPSSMQTIYNPFDLEQINKLSLASNTEIPTEPYIIHVGRLAKQKRHDVLFAALALMDEPIKLVLLCNKPEKAIKLAKKYNVAHRLILPGFQANPYNWIQNAELLVLSSDYEGFGNVLLEAIAVGTKVVSTACPHGPDEILTGELSQFLVPRREPRALAKAMSNCIGEDINLSQAEILTKVCAQNIAKQYLSLI